MNDKELLSALRGCDAHDTCRKCGFQPKCQGMGWLMQQAADRIMDLKANAKEVSK